MFSEWAEDAEPYLPALSSVPHRGSTPIYVDDRVRLFVVECLVALPQYQLINIDS